MTTPLITTADGGKMGKTVAGAVWLHEDQLPHTITGNSGGTPTTATSAGSCELFTDLPLDEIARLEALEGAEINQAKIALANAATAMLHGDDAARAAEETARRTFEEGASGDNLPSLAQVHRSGSSRH